MTLPDLRPTGRAPRGPRAPGPPPAAVLAPVAHASHPLPAPAGEGGAGGAPATTARAPAGPWPQAVVDLASNLPMQEGGRVMPLDTFAGYTLLKVNHRRSFRTADDRKLSPVEWLLDVLLLPDLARGYECFAVDNDEVLDAIGARHEGKKKRDRYSYDLLVGKDYDKAAEKAGEGGAARVIASAAARRSLLDSLAARYRKIEARDQEAVEAGIVDLSDSVDAFERLVFLLEFGRASLDVGDAPALAVLFGGEKRVSLSHVLAKAGELRQIAGAEGGADPHGGPPRGADEPATPDQKAARDLRRRAMALLEGAGGLALVPPRVPTSEDGVWFRPRDILGAALDGVSLPRDYAVAAGHLFALAESGGDPAEVEAHLRAFHDESVRLARSRGEYDKVPLEVFLNRLDPFGRAVLLYLLGFLVVAVTWLTPNRWVRFGGWGLLLAALLLHVTGIVIRCVLRDRPPIGNLYDTFLFISALGAGACLVMEWINGKGIALACAPVVGGLVLFLANQFEALKGEDTMRPLQAVLDTNFWLATHVTTISIGYSGGLLAAILAHFTVLGRVFGVGSDGFYRTVFRMTYGMLCFGLLFSVVGTILGGIWANDSWGRFWGWDPKENGALLICLSQLAILHARMGGYLKPFGFAMANIFAGCVVVFSWQGVNLLGIGLHAYGFSGGLMKSLLITAYAEGAVLAAGATIFFLGRAYGPPAAPAA